MTTKVGAPRARKSFSRLKHVLDLPNLIDIQKASFDWFLQEGLRETIDDISPIEDYTGTLAVEFGEYWFGEPQFTITECREKDLTYQVPLSMTVRFVNKDTGEIREQTVFMGDFPMMTEWGTFIINGTERVIVTQLVRSPGAYLMEPKDATKQVFTANLMPSRGSWLELEIDKKGVVYTRIDRKRKLPITTLLRALPAEDPSTGFELDTSTNEAILKLFNNSIYILNTLEKDISTREEEALIEVFKKQRPGEPPTLDNARNLLRSLFFDPKRYDLTKVGRYKLNQRLGVDVPEDTRVLTTQDILALVQKLVELPDTMGVDVESKDYAADAAGLSRDPIRGELDEYEHFGNRRLRTVGELIQEAFRVGLYRMERVVRERMTTEDVDAITPQTIINIRPVVAALKEFFGSSQLSQFMQQTNSLDGLTHRRRLSALGAGGLTRERAPIEVRDVHPTHYGRMCPIETPEGPNIGLIGSLASYATVSEFGFVQTPYRVVNNGRVSDEIIYLDAAEEAQYTIAQASERIDDKGKFLHDQVLCRSREGEAVTAAPKDVEYMDVDPAQIVSIATALIPFLEHNDANRALMGANMQRQAVPLMITQAPLVGTGVEYRAAIDSGDVVLAKKAGRSSTSTRSGSSSRRRTARTSTRSPSSCARTRARSSITSRSSRSTSGSRPSRCWRTALPRMTASSLWAPTCCARSCRSRATTSRTRSSSRSGWSRRTCSPRSTFTSTRSTHARPSWATRRSPGTSPTARRSRCATSTSAGSSASEPRSAPETCSSARSRPRARPS